MVGNAFSISHFRTSFSCKGEEKSLFSFWWIIRKALQEPHLVLTNTCGILWRYLNPKSPPDRMQQSHSTIEKLIDDFVVRPCSFIFVHSLSRIVHIRFYQQKGHKGAHKSDDLALPPDFCLFICIFLRCLTVPLCFLCAHTRATSKFHWRSNVAQSLN